MANASGSKRYIYIAYRHNDTKRRRVVTEVAELLRSFGYESWYDKGEMEEEKRRQNWPNQCGEAMRETNAFLLLAHKDTHTGATVTGLEIPAALTRWKNRKYDRIVVLIMDRRVKMENYNPLLDPFPRIKNFKKGWENELRKQFEIEEASLDRLLNLIGTDNPKNQMKAGLLIQELLDSTGPIDLQKGLRLLLKNYTDKETRDRVFNAIDSLRKKVASKTPLIPKRIRERPEKKQIRSQKRMLEKLEKEHSKVIQTAGKLYEGLIYLLKEFNLRDKETLRKIRTLLGITAEMEKIIINKLLEYKIVMKVGGSIWFVDDKLGRHIMEEVFFGKKPLIEFSRIEELFYGQS